MTFPQRRIVLNEQLQGYTFLQADGLSLSIPTHEMSVETYLRVLFLLKEISVTAQTLFVPAPGKASGGGYCG
jgi:hypothetical protein